MKNKTINLKLTFQTFDGHPIIKGGLEVDEKKQKEILTLKDTLIYMLGQKNAHGKEAVMVWSLGRRIYEGKEGLEVTNEELAFLKQMVEENPLGLFKAIVIGQVLEYLEKLKA